MNNNIQKQRSIDTFSTKDSLLINNQNYLFFSLGNLAKKLNVNLFDVPFSIKIILENLLRHEDGINIRADDIKSIILQYSHCKIPVITNSDYDHENHNSNDSNQSIHNNIHNNTSSTSILNNDRGVLVHVARVIMQDFTGVPAMVDLAAMRDKVREIGYNASLVSPLIPVDLIIDHSIQVDDYANKNAMTTNLQYEFSRNAERYKFLRWSQESFNNFRVIPPSKGICHQVNLEFLATIVCSTTVYDQQTNNKYQMLYPDFLVGTDSHTTMINSLGIMGWGVGGIEAEAAMLGQPLSIVLPKVVGVYLKNKLKNEVNATDLVLTITQILRQKDVVGKFVEFYGPGLAYLSLPDRATISNMAPEYGAICGLFPIDSETINYMRYTNRPTHLLSIIKDYAIAQGLWSEFAIKKNDTAEQFTKQDHYPKYDEYIELDLSTIETSMAGPRRPQDRVSLGDVPSNFNFNLNTLNLNNLNVTREFSVTSADYKLTNGCVVISAITSCTNTSNPFAMIGAGLLAQKATALGLKTKPWVKTSLAPGSQVVTEYIKNAGLDKDLEKLGFYLVGYGCTTCIGNSGPLLNDIEDTINQNQLVVCSVLSGNRNFEGRVHPLVRANYLASPMLCIAYALVGNINFDWQKDSIGITKDNKRIFLKDIWPTNDEINHIISTVIKPEIFNLKYQNIFNGSEIWNLLYNSKFNDDAISVKINAKEKASQNDSQDSQDNNMNSKNLNFNWEENSTYIKRPPYFQNNINYIRNNVNNDVNNDVININKADHANKHIKHIHNAKILCIFGDSITTDHISPAGSIHPDSPAGKYLLQLGIEKKDFNSYGSRRGNHEVMIRGTFANTRIRNKIADNVEGGYTKYFGVNNDKIDDEKNRKEGEYYQANQSSKKQTEIQYKTKQDLKEDAIKTKEKIYNNTQSDFQGNSQSNLMSIYDAAMLYKKQDTRLVIFAGKEYGTGSSRDWAAKGTKLLGVDAVIAQSFESIHRSNLVCMGVIPFVTTMSLSDLNLIGNESITIIDNDDQFNNNLNRLNGTKNQNINNILQNTKLINNERNNEQRESNESDIYTLNLQPNKIVKCIITKYNSNESIIIDLLCKINTEIEIQYIKYGGILPYALQRLIQ